MKLAELLNNRNMNDEVYLSDVDRWILHKKLPFKEKRELVIKLTELAKGLDNGKSHRDE